MKWAVPGPHLGENSLGVSHTDHNFYYYDYNSSPHFSQIGYCGGRSCRPAYVPLLRPSRRTVEYDCESLSREALSGRHLHRLATQTCEKCGLEHAENFE
jgi:hypothetical protein